MCEGSVYLTKDAVIKSNVIPGLNNLPVSELFTKGDQLMAAYYGSSLTDDSDEWRLGIVEIGDDGYITQIADVEFSLSTTCVKKCF